MKTVLTKNQTKVIGKTVYNSKLYPEFNGKYLKINIRYDDECGNGHNSFAITGECGGRNGIGGCIHDFIIEQAPELEKYIKWHLTSSDGPMHYVANSMYHAREIKKNTVIRSYDECLQFNNFPFTYTLPKRLKAFIETYEGETIHVVALTHPKNGIDGEYQYGDNYTFKGCSTKWYESLFSTEKEAREMSIALMNYKYKIIKTIASYEDEQVPNLEHARSSAIWPEAELCDFTEKKLTARLSGLMTGFKESMLELGFTY